MIFERSNRHGLSCKVVGFVLTKRPIRHSKYQEHGKRGHEAIDADLESERPGKRNVVTVNSDPYRQFESDGDTSEIWSGHPTTQA